LPAAVLLAAVLLAGCGGSTAPTGGATGRSITVYSGQHQQTTVALTKDFQRRTGIAVNLRSNDEAALANQLLREGSSSPADVFYAENPPALTVLAKRAMFAQVAPATLARVPARFDSPRGDWVGVSARSAVLVYNTGRLTPAQLPASLRDLAGPVWAGKLGFAPTETDFQPLITALAKLDGQASAVRWLTGLKHNGKVYDSNETLIAAVNRGEVAAGLIDHYYFYRLQREVGSKDFHSALHYYSPGDPGALVDVSGAAVLKSSRNPALAQQFLAYLVSRPAQELIARSQSFEYPLGSGVTTAQPLRPFAALHPPVVGIEDLGDGRASLALLQEVGLL